MRISRLALPAGAALLWSLASFSRAEEDTLPWISNYREAIAEAKRSGKPIFLEFRCEP
jgi:hypothetical protein